VLVAEPGPGLLAIEERGDEDDVGMERGENKGEAEAVVELDLTCWEVDGENEGEELVGIETCGSSVWDV
jgi:hypothetical protein